MEREWDVWNVPFLMRFREILCLDRLGGAVENVSHNETIMIMHYEWRNLPGVSVNA